MDYDPDQDESKLHWFCCYLALINLEMQEKDKLKFQ